MMAKARGSGKKKLLINPHIKGIWSNQASLHSCPGEATGGHLVKEKSLCLFP